MVIFSDHFKGAGILAGGPYDCVNGDVFMYGTLCTNGDGNIINVETLIQRTDTNVKNLKVSNPWFLKQMPIWIFSATGDPTVHHSVVDKTNEYFVKLGSDVEYVNDHPGKHVFPTDLSVNKQNCFDGKQPFIGNCGYDAVGAMWHHIMPNQTIEPLKAKTLDW